MRGYLSVTSGSVRRVRQGDCSLRRSSNLLWEDHRSKRLLRENGLPLSRACHDCRFFDFHDFTSRTKSKRRLREQGSKNTRRVCRSVESKSGTSSSYQRVGRIREGISVRRRAIRQIRPEHPSATIQASADEITFRSILSSASWLVSSPRILEVARRSVAHFRPTIW